MFAASPVPFMVLAANPPDFTITAANDAYYAATLTTPETLIGRRLFDVFTDDPSRPGQLGSEALALSLDRVLTTRRTDAMERVRYDIVTPDGGFEPHWWLAINAPLLDAAGGVSAIIHQVTRVTELHLAEEAEREHQERQAFLLKLSDALRPLTDSVEVQTTAMKLLAERLGVMRASCFEIEEDGDTFYLAARFERGATPMPERMRLSDFSPVVGDAYRAGRTVAVPDTAIRGELVAEPEACAAIGVGAWAAVPLLRNGRLAAWIGVHSRTPREWSAADLQTLNEVAERTRGAVERTRAEHALRESEARLRALVGGVPQPVWRSDGEGSWSWASPRWAEYTGRAGEDAGRGHAWLEAVHPGDRAAVLEAWRGARAGGAFRAEHRLWHAAEGRWRWVQSQALPVRGGAEAGRPGDRAAEWIGATTDVEELRRAQEQRILIEELHHRGRNLLAVVAGIADQMLPSCGSLEEFGACFDQRLVALGRVQNLLSREVAPNVTMEELLRLELEAHGVDTDGTGRVQLRGPGVVLPGGSLQMLALALHELTTNALKHGALNNSTGRLDVAWELRQDGTDAPRLRLDWAEIGADLPDNGGAWSRRGFGLELLEVVLPYDLQGETRLEFGRDGLRCSIELPLAQSVTTSVTARG